MGAHGGACGRMGAHEGGNGGACGGNMEANGGAWGAHGVARKRKKAQGSTSYRKLAQVNAS